MGKIKADKEGNRKAIKPYEGMPQGKNPRIADKDRPKRVKLAEYDESNFLAACVDQVLPIGWH